MSLAEEIATFVAGLVVTIGGPGGGGRAIVAVGVGVGVAVTVSVGVEVAVGVGGGVNVICAAALILAGQATQGQQVPASSSQRVFLAPLNGELASSRVTRHSDARGEVAESGEASAWVSTFPCMGSVSV